MISAVMLSARVQSTKPYKLVYTGSQNDYTNKLFCYAVIGCSVVSA